jgi:hypothetical protein
MQSAPKGLTCCIWGLARQALYSFVLISDGVYFNVALTLISTALNAREMMQFFSVSAANS